MLNYENFRNNLFEDLKQLLPDAKLCIEKANKTNRPGAEEICILFNNSLTGPSINLAKVYEDYSFGLNYDKLLNGIALACKNRHYPDLQHVFNEIDYSRIQLTVINYEKNKEMLKSIPHEKFLDLAVICRYMVPEINGSFIIEKEMLGKGFELTKDELFSLAYANLADSPKNISSMSEMLRKMVPEKIADEEEQLFQAFEKEVPMLVLSGAASYGANVLLDKKTLSEAARILDSEKVVIIPSSIHELIAIPFDEFVEIDSLINLIAEINEANVPLDDQLNDAPYIYDALTKKLSTALSEQETVVFEASYSHTSQKKM